MNGIGSTLKGKLGPLPVYVWALLGTAILAFILYRKKAASAQTQAAADQTNSDLGSASELANLFNVAGLMPYQGGDIFINTTGTAPNPPAKTTGTITVPTKQPNPQATYTISQQDIANNKGNGNKILSTLAKRYGTTSARIWAYNLTPGTRSAATQNILRALGPSNIHAGQSILIPPKNWRG